MTVTLNIVKANNWKVISPRGESMSDMCLLFNKYVVKLLSKYFYVYIHRSMLLTSWGQKACFYSE